MKDDSRKRKAIQAEATLPEIVEIKRHAVQVLIDTLDDGESDMSAYYLARDKMDALYETAVRNEITWDKLRKELDDVWATMRAQGSQGSDG